MTEIGMKSEFLKNGFQVMKFQFESDPLSGRLSGHVKFQTRIQANRESQFDKFISNTLGLTIKSKKC